MLFLPCSRAQFAGLVLITATVVIAAGLALSQPTHELALAQGQPAQTPPPVASLDPTVAALQATVAAQQTTMSALSKDLELARRELELVRNEVNADLDKRFLNLWIVAGVVTAVGAVLGFFGVKGYKELKSLYYDKMRETLQKNLYQLDPTFLPILIPEQGFDAELARIELSGLKDIQKYQYLGKGTCSGVVIVRAASAQDEKRFVDFVQQYGPKPTQAAYILYSPAQTHKIKPETFALYNNLTVATNPTALARAILDVGRGLKPVSSEEEVTRQDT